MKQIEDQVEDDKDQRQTTLKMPKNDLSRLTMSLLNYYTNVLTRNEMTVQKQANFSTDSEVQQISHAKKKKIDLFFSKHSRLFK